MAESTGTEEGGARPRRPVDELPASEVDAFYDAQAARYDQAHDGQGLPAQLLSSRMDGVLRALGEYPGDVLDAGMGPGRTAQELDRRGWRVWGVDSSAEMVGLARRRLPHAQERLVRASIEELPFAPGSFDTVLATGVLVEYTSAPERALSEFVRVLRPGGRLVVSVPNDRCLAGRWRRRVYVPLAVAVKRRLSGTQMTPYARQALPLNEVVRMVTAVGLHPESYDYTSYLALLSPLDLVFEALAVDLSRRLEAVVPRRSHLFASQIVIAFGKPGTASRST